MTTLILSLELGIIIFTNFDFDHMTNHSIKTITIALVFVTLMILKFNQINTLIINESILEAKFSYQEKDTFKRMFDGLQEGIIVTTNNKITFMNELSNKVISHLTDSKDFF